ncbi:MAG TPA: hypothetical protein VK586_09030 [Streptosporangiaceae bacterium]|nr:hypothetical protein [Streptosporangiaceae bacterium]
MSDDPPRGVRIRHLAGDATECTVIRDPGRDRDGDTAWLAQLPPGILLDPAAGDALEADYLPGRCILGIDIDMSGPGAG